MQNPKHHIPVEDVFAAAERSQVIEVMQAFYEEVDERIARKTAACQVTGRCCQFGTYGHRLYITTLEAAYYLATGSPPPPVTGDACPHLVDGKCEARGRRPLGCRIFYCDPRASDWQGPLTEEYHARLRSMHSELNVPYFYADFLSVMKALNQQSPAANG